MAFSTALDSTIAVNRLFFAVQPDAAAARAAYGLVGKSGLLPGLTGRPLPMERLHVTMHWLGDHPSVPPELVLRATAAAGALDMSPFSVQFDRVESLGDANHGGPLVLTGGAALSSLRQAQRALAAAMADAGIGRYVRTAFKPHMTLVYDDKYFAPQAVRPVGWTVHELVLVHSLVGKSRHTVLGRWPLRSRQMGFDGW